MKIEGKKTEPKTFKPVEITLTFENQNELDVIGSMFNSCNIVDKVIELTESDDRLYDSFLEVFKNAGADVHKYPGEFAGR